MAAYRSDRPVIIVKEDRKLMNHIEFWFEFASTYSYPAALRLEPLARHHGIQIEWRPFLLGPIFKRQGWNDSPFNLGFV